MDHDSLRVKSFSHFPSVFGPSSISREAMGRPCGLSLPLVTEMEPVVHPGYSRRPTIPYTGTTSEQRFLNDLQSRARMSGTVTLPFSFGHSRKISRMIVHTLLVGGVIYLLTHLGRPGV